MDSKLLSNDEFIDYANGRARTRRMDDDDYARYRAAYLAACHAREMGQPFYRCRDAGGVANKYGYTTTTAQWAVWIEPATWEVKSSVGRVWIHSRHVPEKWRGGERSYLKHGRECREAAAGVIKWTEACATTSC